MTDHSKAMRDALELLDVKTLRRLWLHVAPTMPQPDSDEAALKMAHIARTQMSSMKLRVRAYSHSWLRERSLPSMLPDELKPRAERMYPVAVGVVGISVNAPAHRAKLAKDIRSAMESAVLDCYANGDTDPSIVKPQMMLARDRVLRG